MRALDRKLWRDLRRLWAQSVAIALVLACGVMILILASGTLRSLTETRDAYYDRQRFADIFARATRVPDTLLPEIAAIPGLASAEPRIVLDAVADVPGMVEPATLRLLSLPRGGAALNLPLLRAGRMPHPDHPAEVAVSEPFAQEHHLQPGASLSVTLGGVRRDLTVTGIVLSPEFIYAMGPSAVMPDDRRFGIVWMSRAALAAAGNLDGAFNDLSLALTRGANPVAVIATLDRLLAPFGGQGAVGRDLQTSHAFLASELDQLQAMALILPPVFLIVAAALVNMVLGRLIALDRTQIGLLKALGYSDRRISGHYLKLSLWIGVLGVGLGWAAGWRSGQAMTALYADYFRFPFLLYRPGTAEIVISGLTGMAAVAAGALRPVWAAVRLPPAVALAPPAPPRFRRGWADAVFGRFHLRQTTMMILRSMLRWPGRAAITLGGVAASIALLVAAFFTMDVMGVVTDEIFNQSNRQHVTLVLAAPAGVRAVQDAAHLPAVRVAEGGFAVPVRLRAGAADRLAVLTARAPDARLTQVLDLGGGPLGLPRSGIVLPDRLADRLGVAPGDTVTLELLAPPRGTHVVQVAAVIRQSLGQDVLIDATALHALMGQAPQVTRIDLLTDTRDMPLLHAAVKGTPAIAGVIDWTEVRARFDELIDRNMRVMMLVYAAIGMLVTVGVVYNAARIQLAERQHELATLRVLGFGLAEVGYVLWGEMMILSLLAVPLGLAAGYGLSAAMAQGFSTDVISMPLAVSTRTMGMAAGLALASALGAALVVARRLAEVDLVSTLKQKD
ncbi:MAG TPA: FtsX-like permease family protein [Paracoccaceae bacterium]|nr:FtsX-like permease family protein [Paracoccaceae bacterium]